MKIPIDFLINTYYNDNNKMIITDIYYHKVNNVGQRIEVKEMELSSDQILQMKEPWELFKNPENIEVDYKNLVKVWHPDKNDNSKLAENVMMNINGIYHKAKALIKSGKWEAPGYIRISGKSKVVHEIKYRTKHKFELGTMYVANRSVIWLIEEKYTDLLQNGERAIQELIYCDEKMKEEFERCVPKVIARFETADNRLGLVVEKAPDLFLLRDVLNYYEGKIPERHVAWILSRLNNIVCYLDYNGISVNGITTDTVFISPKYHGCALLGGWWYSVKQGEKMIGTSNEVFTVMPPQVKDKKLGNILTDMEAIRLIGRELLGDRNGNSLSLMSSAPDAMISWLRGAATSNAFEELTKWKEVLEASFGERKFVEMDLNEHRLYSKIMLLK
jgi:hypothetical protein